MYLFEDFIIKALFGFVAAFITAVILGVLYIAFIEVGVYMFWVLLGMVVFYLIGHWLHENL